MHAEMRAQHAVRSYGFDKHALRRASKDNAFSCSHRCCIPLGWGNLESRDRGKGNKLSLSPSQLYRQDSMQ